MKLANRYLLTSILRENSCCRFCSKLFRCSRKVSEFQSLSIALARLQPTAGGFAKAGGHYC
jgi:hypothetical protein